MAARSARFDPRKLMELAIDVMRCSVHEPRGDGRSSPQVGALLWKPDGTIETACRGELRDGDHAEYTLLERKNRSAVLDECVLFATLEPCAPGARRDPKLACAERIVLARIKKVWVGIEDPDPTVDRKGIKYLQDHGVDVKMFDRDLQDVIRADNEQFIAQALERARAATKARPVEVRLSRLESPASQTSADDLSKTALDAFRARNAIRESATSAGFRQILEQLALLKQDGNRLVPTGFGYLLFGRRPRAVLPQAGVLARIEYPDGSSERREFDEPLVLIPEMVEEWLRSKLPHVFTRDASRRKTAPSFPYTLVREGLVNALIHRDYDLTGAKVQLVVDEDTIRISSPGEPPPPITVEQLRSFKAPMLSRNPALHYVFGRMELAEEQGFGVGDMRRTATDAGLPLPKYGWEAPYLTLTLYRHPAAARAEIRQSPVKLGRDDAAAWEFISKRGRVTRREVMDHLVIDARKAQRILRKLVDAGVLRQEGAGPATHFEVVSK